MKKWILTVLSLAMGCNPVLAYNGLQQKSTSEQVFDFLHNNQTVLKVGLSIGILGLLVYKQMYNFKKNQKLKEEREAAEYLARMREAQRRQEEREREATARRAAREAEEKIRRERQERERKEREAREQERERQWQEELARMEREAEERRRQRERESAAREQERAERNRKREEEFKRAEELRKEAREAREQKRKNEEEAWRCSHEFEENLRKGFRKERDREEKKRKEEAAREEAARAWSYFQEQARRNAEDYRSSSSYAEDPTVAAYRALGVPQNATDFAVFGLPRGTSKAIVKKKHIELTKKYKTGLTDSNSDSADNLAKEIMQIINAARDQCFEYFDGRKEVTQESAEDVRRHNEEQRRRFGNNTF